MNRTIADPARWEHPVQESQQAFRSLLLALSRPCLPVALPLPEGDAGSLPSELAAIALTMCDQDTAVWLSPSLQTAEVRRWFRFQCGAVLTDSPSGADFAFASRPEDMPRLADLSRGEPEYPDRSTTLCVGGVSFEQGEGSLCLTASGPGIEHPMPFYCNLPEEFTGRWEENHLAFPQGVDLFLCGRGMVAGLPRSTCLKAQKEETPCM